MTTIKQTWDRIDAIGDRLWAVAGRIHDRPELAFEESYASELLAGELEEAGYRVEKGIGGLPTAFRADHESNSKSSGPSIALIAEYDALPGIGHACGHHLIASASLGAALGLIKAFYEIPAKLVVLGTPGEEGGGGKVKLLRAGSFRGIDVAMMVHPGDETWSTRQYLALLECEAVFRGKAAHTVANPAAGINALDALVMLYQAVHAARVTLGDDVWMNGIVTEGGALANIIPERAVGRFQIRSTSNDKAESALEKLRQMGEGCSAATGATYKLEPIGEMYETLVANEPLARAYESYTEQLGFPCVPSPSGIASTDLGNVSWHLPVLHPHINVLGDDSAALHSREFAEKSMGPDAKSGMLTAAKALAAIAHDLGSREGFLDAVVSDFRSRTATEG